MESDENIRTVVRRMIAENPDPGFSVTDDPAAEVAPVSATFLPSLARVLEHLCGLCVPTAVSRFDAVRPPQISIEAYLQRLQKYFACSGECFVLALVYLDRVVKFHPTFVISKFNIHRLLVTCVMCAAKFFDDVWYSNQHYAKVGGVQLRELNQLEVELMRLLKWNITVSPEEFDQYMGSVTRATLETPGSSPGSPTTLKADCEGTCDTDDTVGEESTAASSSASTASPQPQGAKPKWANA